MNDLSDHDWVLALDVGGTKLAATAVLPDGSYYHRSVVPTDAREGGQAVLLRLLSLSDTVQACMTRPPVGIGVATHGIVDRAKRQVRFASDHLPGWTGISLREAFSERFRSIPLSVINDGHAATLGEYRLGTGRGLTDFVMLSLGTGVGGGVISGGELLFGAHDAGSRLGHLSIDPCGEQCSCGNRGCLEQYVSGDAVARAAQLTLASRSGSALNFSILPNSDDKATGKDVVDAARAGDTLAKEILETAGTKLGFALVQITRIFDPQRITIGGGMAAAGDWLLQPARAVLAATTPSVLEPPSVVVAHLGADAVLIGAGLVAWRDSPGSRGSQAPRR